MIAPHKHPDIIAILTITNSTVCTNTNFELFAPFAFTPNLFSAPLRPFAAPLRPFAPLCVPKGKTNHPPAYCAPPISSINAFASSIDASISAINEAISPSSSPSVESKDAIARALRLCFKNNT